MLTSEPKLEQIKPLNRRQTAVSVNCIIMRMVDVLNEFAENADRTLLKAERHLKDASIKLSILERKLASVKLDDVKEKVVEPVIEEAQPSTSAEPEPEPENKQETEKIVVNEEHATAPTSSSNRLLIRDDPKYSKYFKMLKMGVVEQAVVIKMKSENVDPTILQRGDEPSPNPVKQDSDSEFSSFSDSD